jgi:parallel beta-helix repeat protein
MLLSQLFGRGSGRTHRSQPRRRLIVESLEGRQLLATFTVTDNNDSGPGSLRQAIISSNATRTSAPNLINFDIGNGGVQTIALESSLPAVTRPVSIDGTTQSGTGSAPRIVLDGTNAGSLVSGITFETSNSTFKGVAVDNFTYYGVVFIGGSGNTIADNYVGLTPSGAAAGNAHSGVLLCNDTSENTVVDNVISANGGNGFEISKDANHNAIIGNLVGTNPAGTAALQNNGDGAKVELGAYDNVLGGTAAGAGNVFSGNGNHGVEITNGAPGNVVEGNRIGTNAAGTTAVGNAHDGVLIDNCSDGNAVGGTDPGASNVIAGNAGNGVMISNGSHGNVVEGDLIGTNASGSSGLGNGHTGVFLNGGAYGNVVGGTAPGASNTIENNGYCGVGLIDAGGGNAVEGNVINANGFSQPNAGVGDGVYLMCSAGTTISNNTIQSNRDWGIALVDSSSCVLTGNTFRGNGLGDIHS